MQNRICGFPESVGASRFGLRSFALFLLLLLGCLAPFTASAHKLSDAYFTVVVSNNQITGTCEVALRDLEVILALDSNLDGAITWDELRAKQTNFVGYVSSRIQASADSNRVALAWDGLKVSQHLDGAYAVLELATTIPETTRKLELAYSLLWEEDPLHRGLLNLRVGTNTTAAVFSQSAPTVAIDLEQPASLTRFDQFLVEGVLHIWIGYDHILFLVALLLPAVMALKVQGWRPAEAFKPAAVNVLKVVTAFTVAHSITLSLAALEVVRLPSRLVESTIALSVIIAAANNLKPFFRERGWVVAFGFGLIHGFGFAGVLGELGLPTGSLVPALIGFNLGVELGQLAIVAVFLPVAFLIRSTTFYYRVALQAGSVAISLVAALWFVDRAFGIGFMPF